MAPINRRTYGTSFIYLIVIALILTGLYFYNGGSVGDEVEPKEVQISEIYSDEHVKEVEVDGNQVTATLDDGTKVTAVKEPDDIVSEHFPNESGVKVNVIDTEKNRFWTDILIGMVPFVLIIGFLFFMMRQAQSSNTSALSFGKSRARLYNRESSRITFKDVAGVKEAKEELQEIVEFLKNPGKFVAMGAKIPRGVMLFGAPGTGKTLLAKAVAGEAKVPFFNISGSEFVEMFVGVGASRVRDLFSKAKRNAPCIIFIDEIDAVGRQRGAGLGGGHDEREQTLNQILVEMDGFDTNTNVIVIAATNRPDVLDPALLRPGRFDRRIVIDRPDLLAREEILEVHGRGKPLSSSVVLQKIARQTPGFSGADLESLMNEAAILSAKRNKKKIGMEELEHSIEKVMMGPERKSKVLSDEEKKITAYHEAGHALVAKILPHCDPVHKISIISRGMALGVTWYLPEQDKHLQSVSHFKDELAAMLGGHVSEMTVFGEVTTGSSNDLTRATEVATQMVTQYGMSRLGPVIYERHHGTVFLGRELAESKQYSEETAAKIDQEVESILKEAYSRAEVVITKHRQILTNIAEELIRKETLNDKEFSAFFSETPLPAKRVTKKSKSTT